LSRLRKPHLRCPDCRLHRSLCICALLPRLDTRTRVLLVVHQLEATKPTNTGLLAARCLVNSAVAYRGRGPDGAAAPDALDPTEGRDVEPMMLFPHPDATPLDAWRGTGKPLVLVVPDATWGQAARARRRGALRALPCVSLPPDAIAALRAARPDARLRWPTHPDRLATLEALALALGILEGPGVRDALLHVYRVMADRTLWTNGRLPTEAVTGGIPAGVRSHDPLSRGRG
jgi:DTW domain-containing protein YfiP